METVGEGITIGIVTALTWAGLIFLANYIRSLILEYRLRKGFGKIGYTFGENSFGVFLRNETNISVKVWGVSFSFPNGGFAPLCFSGEKTPSRRVKLRGFFKAKRIYIDFPQFRSEEIDGGVSLDFDMAGTWSISKDRLTSLEPLPTGAYCLLEYVTLFNTKKRIVVSINQVDGLRDAILRCRKRWAGNNTP